MRGSSDKRPAQPNHPTTPESAPATLFERCMGSFKSPDKVQRLDLDVSVRGRYKQFAEFRGVNVNTGCFGTG